MLMRAMRLFAVLGLLALVVGPTVFAQTPTPAAPAAPPATPGPIDCSGVKSGDQLSIISEWSGGEGEQLDAILKPFADACGVKFATQATRDAAVLDAKAKSAPPDVIFWPSTSPMLLYTGQLKDLKSLGADPSNYLQSWINLGTVGGKWLAVPVKTDIKTIIWYSPANFKLFNYTVPTTWAELNALVNKMVTDGNVPWSMGFESGPATGWTGADFIEDILLVQQGPDYVSNIISGTVAYNDAGVKDAWRTYGQWATDPKFTVGGATGTVSTPFLEAIYKVFSSPPQAMMVRQSGFTAGEIARRFPNLKFPTDYNFFGVPGAKGMQIGADYMMAFSDSAATKALVKYLTGANGAIQWAKVGFDLSPNKLAVGYYADPALEKKAEALNAAPAVVPSIGDVIPAPFGDSLWKGIVGFVNGGNLDTTLNDIAKAQAEALNLKK
jgi:alpha-glucoside transport system substrate-binding protein